MTICSFAACSTDFLKQIILNPPEKDQIEPQLHLDATRGLSVCKRRRDGK